MNINNKLACFAPLNWENSISGVSTFLYTVKVDWKNKYDCVFIEYPSFAKTSRNKTITSCEEAEKPLYAKEQVFNEGQQSRGDNVIRLFLGYLHELFRNVRFVYSVKPQLKGRIILVNTFGCETLPIAVKLVNPFSKVIGIAHTHPGCDSAANHPVRRMVEKLCYRMVDDIVYNSNALKQKWTEKLRRPNIKGQVIYHGFDQEAGGVPADYPAKSEDCIDFVYLARFYKWKGQANFLIAWKMALDQLVVRKTNLKIRLLFVGDGVALDGAKTRAQELRLESSVVFLGSKDNGAEYFNGGDVAVLMSTEDEAFGFVLLEAMSRKKPVLASRLGGIREVVKDGETGLLVDPMNTKEVANTITKMAESQQFRMQAGEKGFKRWKEMFSVERMFKEYDELFLKMAG